MKSETLVEVYRRLSTGCESVNQLNKLNIRFENRMTPREKRAILEMLETEKPSRVLNLYRRVLRSRSLGSLASQMKVLRSAADLFEARHAWAQRLRKNEVAPADPSVVWMRHQVAPGLSYYRRPDLETSRLIVSFTGQAGRMMMAVSDYLVAIEPVQADVLVVRTDIPEGYVQGLPGSGGDFDSSLRAVKDWVEHKGYEDIKVVGVSGGVIPALTFCGQISPTSVLVVGPTRAHISEHGESAVRALANKSIPASTRYVIAYGSDSKDRDSADFLARGLGGSTLEVQGAGHAAMRQVVEQVGLEEILSS